MSTESKRSKIIKKVERQSSNLETFGHHYSIKTGPKRCQYRVYRSIEGIFLTKSEVHHLLHFQCQFSYAFDYLKHSVALEANQIMHITLLVI